MNDQRYCAAARRAQGGLPAILLCLSALAAGGCKEMTAPADPEPIVLAASYSATGRFAAIGNEVAHGFRLAVDMVNEKGGVAGRPLTLILRDDASDAETSAGIYADYVASDSIDVFLGPYSSPLTEAAVNVTEASSTPMVAPMAAAPSIWAGRSRRWSVQMLNPGTTYLQGSVELVAQNGGRTAALVYEESAFPRSVAQGVREAAEAHGVELVLDRGYQVGGADHVDIVRAARDAGADLFIGGGYYDDAVAFTRTIVQSNYAPRLVSLNLGPARADFFDDLGEQARCVAGNSPWVPTIRTKGHISDSQTFVRHYEEDHERLPSYYGAGGFGAVELVSEAIWATTAELAEIDPAKVRDYLFTVATETVLGPFGVRDLQEDAAGAQISLKGLQVQWQADDSGKLSRKIVHPAAVANAQVCFTGGAT